jgi:hypothetical protein
MSSEGRSWIDDMMNDFAAEHVVWRRRRMTRQPVSPAGEPRDRGRPAGLPATAARWEDGGRPGG